MLIKLPILGITCMSFSYERKPMLTICYSIFLIDNSGSMSCADDRPVSGTPVYSAINRVAGPYFGIARLILLNAVQTIA